MREKIEMTTVIWLGARGDISTVKRDHTKSFTIEDLMKDRVVVAHKGEEHCVMYRYRALGSTIALSLASGENVSYETIELAQFLTQAGLELEGADNGQKADCAEYAVGYTLPEHLPSSGMPESVRPNTPLYLTAMGTISLSKAADQGELTPFTALDLRNGRTAIASNGRMAASIVSEGNDTVRYTFTCDEPPYQETSLTTIGYLLGLNGLELQG